jgi:hypothetical protein
MPIQWNQCCWGKEFEQGLDALLKKHAHRLWALGPVPDSDLMVVADLDLKIVDSKHGMTCPGSTVTSVVAPKVWEHCGAKRDCRPAPCICKCDPCVKAREGGVE